MKTYNKKAISLIAVIVFILTLSPYSVKAAQNAFKDPVITAPLIKNDTVSLAAVKNNIKGGSLDIGSVTYAIILFKNYGDAAISVGTVNLYPSSNISAEISLNKCSDILLIKNSRCAITIAVTGKKEGFWRVKALVEHSGNSMVATADVTGSVKKIDAVNSTVNYKKSINSIEEEKHIEKEFVEIYPHRLDFGTSTGNSAMSRVAVLQNNSLTDIDIENIAMDIPKKSGFSYKSFCSKTLMAGERCNIIITWKPVVIGLAQGVLTVSHTGKRKIANTEVIGNFKPLVIKEVKVKNISSVNKIKFKKMKPKVNNFRKIDLNKVVKKIAIIAKVRGIKDFKITSLSAERAVINGYNGAFIVRNGETITILDKPWLAAVISSGVLLIGENEEINLIFNRALKPVFNNKSLLLNKSIPLNKARRKPPLIKGLKMINP